MKPVYAKRLGHLAAGAVLACAVIAAGRASAEVLDATANGFTVRETAHIAAAPGKVYAALIAPADWWSSSHTFSGNAANMTFDARAGGSWCETLPNGGSALLMTVARVVPGKALVLRGGLGPFQTMAVEGVMVWSLTPVAGGTDVMLVNANGGYSKDGLDKISHVADMVMSEQLARLKAFVETGSAPEEKKP
jgi:uncharacterized protein YndB with AHSA1/START domain